METFTRIFLMKHAQHVKLYEPGNDDDDDDSDDDHGDKNENRCARRLESYYKLLKRCLLKCSHEWLIKNAPKWFPIVHEGDDKSVEWIIKDIIGNMNTDCAFDFGIYLTKYIASKWKTKNNFPQQYLDFLRDDLEINWALTPHESTK